MLLSRIAQSTILYAPSAPIYSIAHSKTEYSDTGCIVVRRHVDDRDGRLGAVDYLLVQIQYRGLTRVDRVVLIRVVVGERWRCCRRTGALSAEQRAGAQRVPARAPVLVLTLLALLATARLGRLAHALAVRAALLRAPYHRHHVEQHDDREREREHLEALCAPATQRHTSRERASCLLLIVLLHILELLY